MEQTPLPPVVSDAMIAMGFDTDSPRALTPYAVKAIYEADRTKTREEITFLKNEVHRWMNLADGPTARRQFPDGRVPSNSEEAAKGWMELYNTDRAKTREVVRALVDALERTLDPTSFAMTQARLPITEHEYRRALQQGNQAIALAKSQLNISPTKP